MGTRKQTGTAAYLRDLLDWLYCWHAAYWSSCSRRDHLPRFESRRRQDQAVPNEENNWDSRPFTRFLGINGRLSPFMCLIVAIGMGAWMKRANSIARPSKRPTETQNHSALTNNPRYSAAETSRDAAEGVEAVGAASNH